MDGVLLLDKPEGLTSADCVYKLRSILGTKRIGHCGTLDPLATGLLPVCIGEATKFSNYLLNQDKTYEVGIEFGLETNTGDITGEVVSRKEAFMLPSNLKQKLSIFEGKQKQLPPMFSAIKVNGRPLYYWARKGVYIFRNPREIEIKSINLIQNDQNSALIKVECSKGTYIRTLVESLGRNLNCYATVSSLRRISVGNSFIKEESCSLNESKTSILSKLLPCDALLEELKKVYINPEDTKKVRNGQSMDYNAHHKIKRLVRIYTDKELFIGLGEVTTDKLIPKRLLSTNSSL